MTPDAIEALARAGLSRRDFLRTSGALVVSFSATAAFGSVGAQGPFDTRPSHIDPQRLDSWIAITADGRVTAYTGKCDLGQGMLTAQTQLVAEELSVPPDRVTLIQCDTAVTPDQGTTSGSQSTPTNFNDRNLAQAAATAREALLGLAAERLGVARGQLAITAGVIAATDDRSKRVTYGELVAGKKFNLQLDARARRKPASEWNVLGTSVPRVDMASMATGHFEFVHNVRVPGMLHGAVVRPPEVGATVVSVDESSVRDLPGVVKVVTRKNFIGVVAEKPWQARQAAAHLKVTWTEGRGLPAQRELYESLRKQPSRDTFVVNSKDVDDMLAKAASIVKATYLHPYQMHGSIGTSCAVADVQGGKATVWSPTQSAYPTRSGVAMLLGMRADDVRVIFTRGRLLRDQRRRHGVVRCRAVVAGGGEACAGPALAPGRDGVGELRLPVRDRSARWCRRGRRDRRVGLRGVVCVARRPSRDEHARQHRYRHAGRFCACAVHAADGCGTHRPFQQRQQRRAVVCGGSRRQHSRRRGDRDERARPHAHRGVTVLHGSAAIAVAFAEHVRARVPVR